MSGGTSSESFSWGISVPARHTDAALELLSDVVQHATFDEPALDTERALAIADLEMLRDDMYRYPLRLLTSEAFAGHPYGVPASGTEESLARIDANEVREWHRAQRAGGTERDRGGGRCRCRTRSRRSWPLALRSCAGASGRRSPRPRGRRRRVIIAESREKAQSALALAFPSPSRTDDARFAADMLAGVASGLGGRFFDQLRDRQSLAYTVSAFAAEWRNAGMFVSYIATSPEKEEIARAGLLARVREAPRGAGD